MSKKTLKISKSKFYLTTTVVLAIALVLVLAISYGTCYTGAFAGADGDEVGQKVLTFINTNLLPPEMPATLVGVTEVNGVYAITIDIQGQELPIYASKDGTLLFDRAINMDEPIPEIPTDQPSEIEPRENPTVQLFVMAFCPYGQQAENLMLPVVELLGDNIKVEPHFIVSVIDGEVQSLHGEYEATEGMRQACIYKEYGHDKFWEYLKEFNGVCNQENLDTCWQEKAQAVGIDVTTIESCVETEGITLMESDDALSAAYSVSGSPTLIINDVVYYGSRSAEAYKTGICSGFITPPTECEQLLDDGSGSANGSC